VPRKGAKPVIGDVVEIATPKGLAYAQYSHDSERLGTLLRVLPGLSRARPDDLARIVALPERFFTFFPLAAAVSRGIVHIVGHQSVPDRARSFPLMRMSGSRDKSGRVLDWWLYDGNREWRIGQLAPGQEQLSIAAIWNDTLLIDRIVSGWAPAMAGVTAGSVPTAAAGRAENPDTASIDQLEKAGSRPHAVHEIRHYLYFSKEGSGNAAAQRLAKLGFEVTVERRDDQWAVIARHKMNPLAENMESFRNQLEKVAEASGGEYDGWEAAVVR
jgi:regulator of RNase E activity RraB